MEKRKDIDMLRFYGGDIHQKNKEGEYVITNNLVNPKNKEDMLWGDKDAYRTLNALLFEGIENEKERIYKEKRKLNPVFIELIENTLDIFGTSRIIRISLIEVFHFVWLHRQLNEFDST